MKVVFIEDVPDVALAGETKEVADGYGRNYLLPKKLAVLANSAASNILQAQMKKVAVKRAQAAAEMAEIAEKINGTEITLKAKVGESERLYGSVTAADISEELHKSTGHVIDKRKVVLEEPIRHLGSHDVTIALTHDITALIRVIVEADKVEEAKEEKPERKPRAKKDRPAEEDEIQLEEVKSEVVEAEVKADEPVAAVEEEKEEKPAKRSGAKKMKKEAEAKMPVDKPEADSEDKSKSEEETEPGE